MPRRTSGGSRAASRRSRTRSGCDGFLAVLPSPKKFSSRNQRSQRKTSSASKTKIPVRRLTASVNSSRLSVSDALPLESKRRSTVAADLDVRWPCRGAPRSPPCRPVSRRPTAGSSKRKPELEEEPLQGRRDHRRLRRHRLFARCRRPRRATRRSGARAASRSRGSTRRPGARRQAASSARGRSRRGDRGRARRGRSARRSPLCSPSSPRVATRISLASRRTLGLADARRDAERRGVARREHLPEDLAARGELLHAHRARELVALPAAEEDRFQSLDGGEREARGVDRRGASEPGCAAWWVSSSRWPSGERGRGQHTSHFLSRARQSTFRIARNAFCGISTLPTCFIRFLPSFCFSRSLRLRLMSPP